MSDKDHCIVTTKDFGILEMMLRRCLGREDPLHDLLRHKLETATVMFGKDVPATVVTLSSRVSYRVDGGPAETRIIAADGAQGPVGSMLPITNPRGLALLGLTERQSLTIRRADGVEETVTLEEVIYQPEAARREAERLRQAIPGRPALRVVHRSDHLPDRQAVPWDSATGFDDPGPSAA